MTLQRRVASFLNCASHLRAHTHGHHVVRRFTSPSLRCRSTRRGVERGFLGACADADCASDCALPLPERARTCVDRPAVAVLKLVRETAACSRRVLRRCPPCRSPSASPNMRTTSATARHQPRDSRLAEPHRALDLVRRWRPSACRAQQRLVRLRRAELYVSTRHDTKAPVATVEPRGTLSSTDSRERLHVVRVPRHILRGALVPPVYAWPASSRGTPCTPQGAPSVEPSAVALSVCSDAGSGAPEEQHVVGVRIRRNRRCSRPARCSRRRRSGDLRVTLRHALRLQLLRVHR